MNALAATARAEFDHARAGLGAAVRSGARSRQSADALLVPWAAAVLFCGGELPRDIHTGAGEPLLWIDLFPVDITAAEASRRMALAVRRVATRAIAHQATCPDDRAAIDRATALLRLDEHLAARTNLPPLDIAAVQGTPARDSHTEAGAAVAAAA